MEDLVGVLWEKGECGDPLNALKNLVYRARELLKKLSGNNNDEYILFIHNTYAWNNSYHCEMDTEQFIDCWQRVNDSSKSDDERIQSCKEAVALYRGEFLPKSSYSVWVISSSTYYSGLYSDCILNGCNILINNQRFEEVIHICETALIHMPFEESIHKMLLYAYISSNHRDKAFEHYNRTIDLFYKELGVDISVSLLPIYKALINNIDHVEINLSVIKDDLKEAVDTTGAYFCDYDVFKSIYRVQARMMARTGLSIFIVLFTMTDLEGGIPSSDITQLAMSRLKEAILTSLRMGDTISSYSSTQYILMLPIINYENTELVIARILQNFRFLYRKNDVYVSTKINPLDAIK